MSIKNRITYRTDSWQSSALCAARGIDPELFFIADTNHYVRNRLRKICAICPVVSICLEENLTVPFGMYGGLIYRERIRLWNRRHRHLPAMRVKSGTSFANDPEEYQKRSMLGRTRRRNKLAREIKNEAE